MTPVSYYFIDNRVYPISSEVENVSDTDQHVWWHLKSAPARLIAVADQVLQSLSIGSVISNADVDEAIIGLSDAVLDQQDEKTMEDMRISFVYGLDLIDYAHSRGFLIMGVTIPYSPDSQLQALLFRFHSVRAVIPLDNRPDGRDLIRDVLGIQCEPNNLAENEKLWGLPVIHQIHIRQARKGKFKLFIDRDPAKCIALCEMAHQPSWLHRGIIELYKSWNRDKTRSTRLISVEVYRGDDLIAGEIGVAYKTMYTSLTGFTLEKNVGMIQLLSWFCVLLKKGFEIWDFGMVMTYKSRMGAYAVRNGDWAKIVRHCTQATAASFCKELSGTDCADWLHEQKSSARQVQKND